MLGHTLSRLKVKDDSPQIGAFVNDAATAAAGSAVCFYSPARQTLCLSTPSQYVTAHRYHPASRYRRNWQKTVDGVRASHVVSKEGGAIRRPVSPLGKSFL
ncbi:unnamed protein product, partial [Brenthis ino]